MVKDQHKAERVSKRLTLDLRGTPYPEQLIFMERVKEIENLGESFEILSCDSRTASEIQNWAQASGYVPGDVVEENGFTRVILIKEPSAKI